MNRRNLVLLLAASAFASLLSTPCAHAQGKGLTIAVVNLDEVLDKYYKKKEFDATLRAQHAKRSEVIQEKQKEIGKLQEDAQMFDLGTEPRKRAEQSLYQKRVELEVYAKVAQDEFTRMQRQYAVKLFEDVRARIARYAQQNGIDLVLKTGDSGITANTIQTIHLEIKLRHVLYATDTINITSKVIASLNAGRAGN